MASQRSGPLRAFRIADGRHPIFDGTGAAVHGGRWNSPGRRIIYGAETFSGALLEILAHTNIGRIPKNQVYIEIHVPDGVEIEELCVDELPGWDSADLEASRAYGDAWYDQRRTAVLLVPSVVTRIERNVLINQEHPDFARLRVTEPARVAWDARLLGT
ncbi:MAG: RES domain-containing protein [Acidobacteria bacterium]|nr:RES domain-containing protein [Acidobacteriota bacterium]